MTKDKIRLDDQLCFKFYTISRLIIQTYEPYFKKIGITYTQYLVLLVLWEHDEQPVNDICARLLLGINTISPLIKRMESAGLVGRHDSETDKRKQIVFLTEKGHRLERIIAKARTEMIEKIYHQNEFPEEMQRLRPILDKVVRFFVDYNSKQTIN